MKHIIDDKADIVNLNNEELYLAGRMYNLEPFAMEQFNGGKCRYLALSGRWLRSPHTSGHWRRKQTSPNVTASGWPSCWSSWSFPELRRHTRGAPIG